MRFVVFFAPRTNLLLGMEEWIESAVEAPNAGISLWQDHVSNTFPLNSALLSSVADFLKPFIFFSCFGTSITKHLGK
jgi:hypothetical protein